MGLANPMSATTQMGIINCEALVETRSLVNARDKRLCSEGIVTLSHMIAMPIARPSSRIGIARVLERKASERVEVGSLARLLKSGDAFLSG
ncbi:unannotated protein [freshwater metagenome]|uniref:Unannotated protein n=1 Tax=freshwater metagenome TaxID=449393 RepID=A0A6J6M389_9ZZZZ